MEKDIEQYFRTQLRRRGAMALKFVSPGLAGVPDRVVLIPGGRVVFAEIKAPGKKPRPLQKAVFDRMARLGHPVYLIDSRKAVADFIREVMPGEVRAASISGGSDKPAGTV